MFNDKLEPGEYKKPPQPLQDDFGSFAEQRAKREWGEATPEDTPPEDRVDDA